MLELISTIEMLEEIIASENPAMLAGEYRLKMLKALEDMEEDMTRSIYGGEEYSFVDA